MIRIGIVGAGAIAAVHIDGFLQFGAMCEVAAVCDTYVEKAQSLITEKNLNAKAYADIQTMLTEGALDAISICLPPIMIKVNSSIGNSRSVMRSAI